MWFRIVLVLTAIAMLGMLWVLFGPAQVAPAGSVPPGVEHGK